MLIGLITTIAILVLSLVWVRARLQGPDLHRFDEPIDPPVSPRSSASPAHADVVRQIEEMARSLSELPRTARLGALRKQLDAGFGSPADPSTKVIPVDGAGFRGEWVLAPGSRPDRRLLYLHGGAFVAGSSVSHRGITSRFSQDARAAVLSVDYRLMPENNRQAGIDDCRAAYRWLLENGPDGPSAPETLFVAGDSAGGNLALMLVAWARDAGLRPADGAVALSPGTDATFGSPSLTSNLDSDPMLAPMLRDFLRIPRPFRLLITWATSKMRPCDPVVSPVFGDLSRLPPVLVHASDAELLRDDARRWVNKARAAGSPATLETWPHVVHVWHAFAPELTEANEARERIRAFFDRCASVS